MRLDGFDAFIFDLDGTLIDSAKYHARAFADTVIALSGYVLTPVEYLELFASHSVRFALVLNERHGLGLDADEVLYKKRHRMTEIFQAEVFPGAKEFLQCWHSRMRMALASNSPQMFVEPALEMAGLRDFFDGVITVDDVTNRKPDPEMFQVAMQKMGVDPQHTLVFEDQLVGIEAARRAGTQVIAINNNQPVVFPTDVPVKTWSQLVEETEKTDGTAGTDI